MRRIVPRVTGLTWKAKPIGARLVMMDVSPLRPMMKPDTHGTMTGTRQIDLAGRRPRPS